MLILILFAFIGGVVTILSPCILPILPIILSGSVGGGRRKPYGIVTGFILSFTFFTLFLTSIVKVTGLSPDTLRYISVAILLIFGLTLIVPYIQGKIEQLFSKLSNRVPQQGQRTGFGGGFIIGLSLGLLWTPCVGPILASVISLALTGNVNGSAFIITIAYALGTGLPMLAIMYGGQQLINRVPWLLSKGALIQKIFGVIMIITALLIYFNIDRKLQSYVLEKFPSYGTSLTGLEDNDLIKKQLDQIMETDKNNKAIKLAPELQVGGQWLNSQPLTLAELKGQVVLLDFMTYSCINCIRTFPYLEAWYENYQDDGLVVIGVHTPEFEFEKNSDNVAKALKDLGITFPVMQDNDYLTWKSYENRYWPHTYLIDYRGEIVYDHIGEGNYDTTENKIRELLKERQQAMGTGTELEKDVTKNIPVDKPNSQSPETYFGSSRNSLLSNGTAFLNGQQNFSRPDKIKSDSLYLIGDWNIQSEYAQNTGNGDGIIFKYQAQKIFIVAGADQPITVNLKQDGRDKGSVNIQAEKLYQLIDNGSIEEHTIEIYPTGPGLKAFTFTFG